MPYIIVRGELDRSGRREVPWEVLVSGLKGICPFFSHDVCFDIFDLYGSFSNMIVL